MPAGRMGGQDCDGSVSQQAPIRSLPTRPTDSNLMESLGRADRSTQRHELAGRNEGQIQPSDTVIMLTVVTLRDIEGLSSDDVCAMLEITPANQRVLLHRARAGLRRSIETSLEGGV